MGWVFFLFMVVSSFPINDLGALFARFAIVPGAARALKVFEPSVAT